jgi:hypothetical protein
VNWIAYGKSWQDFEYHDELANSGTLVEIKDAFSGKISTQLIGDVNEQGGVCDCCANICDSDIVLRYAVVFNKEQPE